MGESQPTGMAGPKLSEVGRCWNLAPRGDEGEFEQLGRPFPGMTGVPNSTSQALPFEMILK